MALGTKIAKRRAKYELNLINFHESKQTRKLVLQQ